MFDDPNGDQPTDGDQPETPAEETPVEAPSDSGDAGEGVPAAA